MRTGAPTAVATSSITSGVAPLTVAFDASGSSDPDLGDVLTYEWDLDGDGAFDDSTAVKPTHTYTTAGTYNVQLRVKDGKGGSGHGGGHDHRRRAAARGAKEFIAEADARVEQDHASSNYGTSSSLLVRGGPKLVAESYLRFTVSGITGPIQSATLRLKAGSNGTVDGPAVYTARRHLDGDRHQVVEPAGARHDADRRRRQRSPRTRRSTTT